MGNYEKDEASKLYSRLRDEMDKDAQDLFVKISPRLFEMIKNYNYDRMDRVIGYVINQNGLERAINRMESIKEEKIKLIIDHGPRWFRKRRTIEIYPASEMGSFGINIKRIKTIYTR